MLLNRLLAALQFQSQGVNYSTFKKQGMYLDKTQAIEHRAKGRKYICRVQCNLEGLGSKVMKCYFPVIEGGSESPRKEITAYEVGECKSSVKGESSQHSG